MYPLRFGHLTIRLQIPLNDDIVAAPSSVILLVGHLLGDIRLERPRLNNNEPTWINTITRRIHYISVHIGVPALYPQMVVLPVTLLPFSAVKFLQEFVSS